MKNPTLSRLFKLLTVLCGVFGLLLHLGVIGGSFSPGLFRMFTVQSNLLVIFTFLFELLGFSRRPKIGKIFGYIKFAVMLSIFLTGLVAAAVLGDMLKSADGLMLVSLVFVHIITPVLVLLDWIFFTEKGHFTKLMPLIALIYPLSYCIFIFASAPFLPAGEVSFSGIAVNYRYPYPFLQVDTYGVPLVILCIVLLALFLYGLGWVFFLMDRKAAKTDP